MAGRVQEKVPLSELLRRHPADIAEVLTTLKEEEAVELLRRLYLRRAAAAPLGEMDPEEAARLLAELNRDEALHILSHMDPDDAVDLLLELPEATVRDLLSRLEARKAQMFRTLLAYPPDTAGGLMSPEVLALPAHLTAQEAIEEIRRRAEELETVYYAYVVDEERKLLGVLSLRDLVLARPDTPIHALMNREVVTLPAEMDVEEVAQLFDKYNYLALPVVDKEGHLLGIVTVDDVMDVMREEATEDLLRVGGIPAGEDLPLDPPWSSVRRRLPWLMGLVVLNLSVAGLVSRFEATIAELAFVASLMPLIADMSGNAASQALTVVIRGMALGLVGWKDLPRILWKELRVGLLAGLGLGLQIGLLSLLLWRKPMFGAVAGLALAGTTVGACLTGGAVPFLFKRLKMDPAMMSGPVATTVGDLIGIGLFLSLATAFRAHLA
ncbi:MAG: magnesium transporter [Candidatus Bipolaricaulota bacterium]|nr:magnesium transporter [Candidatus Bipolaricaulota bacterium]MCX7844617.1 magnesium transporter [Candidatus Bipolaricaulota bacterium]MDW8152116.1 magnesium transporter [Candidatus Bipolaricaulota bacterium]